VCVDWKLNKLSSFCLLVVIWQTFDQAFSTNAFASVKSSNMIFVVFISIALFLLYFGVSFFTSLLWLSKEDTISICYCVPAKSPIMGVPLATVMFVGLTPILEAKLQIPMVIYQGLQIVAGSILITPFRKWIERTRALAENQESNV
jgi:solute carrier family 10 (sodium/bile acid cotransporter), member 7